MSIIYILAIGYLDFEIITPAILPAEYCYYHFHAIPFWVDLFYMNGASNGHPEGSLVHYFLLILWSMILGINTKSHLKKKLI